ncbi:MAG: type II secretion system F family protein [Planctomycetes bacterium]|nr:type II secretion system F family protein [Planctomycetota bacterium]MCB9934796.1 type II secretion system F family protein [Planctomycetota bacterium]
MPIFAYEAINAQGQKETGELEAANRNQAILDIRNAGLKPTKVAQRADTAAKKSAAKKEEAGPARGKGGKIKGRASAQQLTDFTAQMAVLIDAGLPVVRSLKVLARQQKPGAFKFIIEDVSESVEQGSSLSEAFANHPRTFDRLYVNMIKAGEAGGILDTILQRLADFMEKAQRLKKKVVGAMIYPIIVMSVAVMILTGIMIFVIPAFKKMFEEQGMELHIMTQILIWISEGIASIYGLIFVVLVAAAGFGITAWGRTPGGERVMDTIKLKLPIFGNIIKKAVTARFTRTLGTLVMAGVPILESLNICKNAIGNVVLGEAIDKVANSIKEGETIAGPLSETGLFDDLVVNMIDVGEETGELDKMLMKVADTFDTYVDIAVESLVSILEPVLIVFMGGAIGFIVIALFLPLVGLIDAIGGA